MTEPQTGVQVKKEFLIPSTLSELSKLLGSYPDAMLMGGGIHCLTQAVGSFKKANIVISVARVADLKKIFRNEHYIELGSAVTISELLRTGREHLQPILREGFNELGPENVKNWSTIGGILCVKDQRLDCFVPLCTLGTEIELRSFYYDGRKKSHRWISLADFSKPNGTLDLAPGEILTRLRIPNEQWNVQLYRKVGSKYTTHGTSLIISIVARVDKGAINDFRLRLGNGKTTIFSSSMLDNSLVGYNLPIKRTQVEGVSQLLTHFCKNLPKTFDSLAGYSTRQSVMEFLSGIYDES